MLVGGASARESEVAFSTDGVAVFFAAGAGWGVAPFAGLGWRGLGVAEDDAPEVGWGFGSLGVAEADTACPVEVATEAEAVVFAEGRLVLDALFLSQPPRPRVVTIDNKTTYRNIKLLLVR